MSWCLPCCTGVHTAAQGSPLFANARPAPLKLWLPKSMQTCTSGWAARLLPAGYVYCWCPGLAFYMGKYSDKTWCHVAKGVITPRDASQTLASFRHLPWPWCFQHALRLHQGRAKSSFPWTFAPDVGGREVLSGQDAGSGVTPCTERVSGVATSGVHMPNLACRGCPCCGRMTRRPPPYTPPRREAGEGEGDAVA